MKTASFKSLDEVRQAVRSKGGTLACPLCGREEFAMEEAAILSGGDEGGYGRRRLQRAQLVCENCGGVVSLDLERLRSGLGESGPSDAGEGTSV